jgi:hypothetical protein
MSYFNRRVTSGAHAETTVSDRLFFACSKTPLSIARCHLDEVRNHRLYERQDQFAYAVIFKATECIGTRVAYVVDIPLTEEQLHDHRFAMTTWWERASNDERSLWGYPTLAADQPTPRPICRTRRGLTPSVRLRASALSCADCRAGRPRQPSWARASA